MRTLEKHITTANNEGLVVYPHITSILKQLNIPYNKYTEWLSTDPDFKRERDKLDDYFIEHCVKCVFDESFKKGGGWLALEILRTKRKSEWGSNTMNNFFTQINLVTNIKSDNEILGNSVDEVQSGG